MRKSLLSAAAAVLMAASLGTAAENPRTLAVTGTAQVSVSPDICHMTFIVATEHKNSAVKAYRENNRIMTEVRDAIRDIGLESKDIQTQNFTITPEYYWDDDRDRNVFEGYEVSHSLFVKVHDLEQVSNILDAAVTAGATQVSGVNYTVENPKKYLVDARVAAIKAARKKAELMAETAGVTLLKPMSISEYEPGGWNRFAAQANVAFDATSTYGGGISLEPGEVKLSLTVNITYEIK